MKMWEINQLSREDIEQQLEDLVEEHQNLRFQHATKQLDNPLLLRSVRRDIARIKTILHELDLKIRSEKAGGNN
ncbi:MAG: 50S ribosomal protein L29 [Calditrichaeota bacterium]|nr:MAG: 50S ribosomal protein L29 [Calditrichota bacterium]